MPADALAELLLAGFTFGRTGGTATAFLVGNAMPGDALGDAGPAALLLAVPPLALLEREDETFLGEAGFSVEEVAFLGEDGFGMLLLGDIGLDADLGDIGLDETLEALFLDAVAVAVFLAFVGDVPFFSVRWLLLTSAAGTAAGRS